MPYKNKITTSRFSHRTVALSAIALLILVSGVLYMLSLQKDASTAATARGAESGVFTNEPGQQKLNLDPPTDAEKQQAEDNKEALADRIAAENAAPAEGRKTVKPQLNSPGQYDGNIEVRAFVPGINEAGGTCTATFTQGSTTFTRSSAGLADATTTRCTPIIVPRGDFAAGGNWTVSVSYTSTTAQGTSDQKIFSVQ